MFVCSFLLEGKMDILLFIYLILTSFLSLSTFFRFPSKWKKKKITSTSRLISLYTGHLLFLTSIKHPNTLKRRKDHNALDLHYRRTPGRTRARESTRGLGILALRRMGAAHPIPLAARYGFESLAGSGQGSICYSNWFLWRRFEVRLWYWASYSGVCVAVCGVRFLSVPPPLRLFPLRVCGWVWLYDGMCDWEGCYTRRLCKVRAFVCTGEWKRNDYLSTRQRIQLYRYSLSFSANKGCKSHSDLVRPQYWQEKGTRRRLRRRGDAERGM